MASTLPTKMLRQIEYYFSDSSFTSDEYLRKVAAEAGGFVPVTTIAGFAKMKALTNDVNAIVACVEEHSDSVILNEDKSGIGRRYPLPEEDPNADRTVHVSGFVAGTPVDLISPVIAAHGAVESVRLLRNVVQEERPLDGSAMVTMASAEAAGTAAGASPLEHTIEDGPYKGTLTIKVAKMADYAEELAKKKQGMKRRREGEGEGSDKKQKKGPPPMPEDYPKGVVVGVAGLGEGVDREKLKEACEPFGSVEWIEYERSTPEAFIRFETAEHATAAAAGLVDKEIVAGITAAPTLLEGDDERAFFKRKHDSMWTRKNNSKGRYRGKSGGRGGRGGGRGSGSRN